MLAVLKEVLSREDKSALYTDEFAASLDALDKVGRRADFCIPVTEHTASIRKPGEPTVYLCGNSLGLQPRKTREYVNAELDSWARWGVEGHFKGERPWVTVDETVKAASARMVGAADEQEVVIMNSLTVNLHLLMVGFYRPAGKRVKILLEEHAFPSDTYAVSSQLLVHGQDPSTAMVTVAPRDAHKGGVLLHTDDILAAIAAAGEELALVLLPGVQYYTGQVLDIQRITAAAHAVGAVACWDLAHAVGNIPLYLHDWQVDCAAWCSYKYLNSGPGGISGVFVHSQYKDESLEDRPHFAGWWGHRKSDRFKMQPDFVASQGAAGWQLSNPPVLQIASLRASLDTFMAAAAAAGAAETAATSSGTGGSGSGSGSSSAAASTLSYPHPMEPLRAKSEALTGYLEALLDADPQLAGEVSIFTPRDPAARGAQLSLAFTLPTRAVCAALEREGIIADFREPNVMRIAPAPLYNTAGDVLQFVRCLKVVLTQLRSTSSSTTSATTSSTATA